MNVIKTIKPKWNAPSNIRAFTTTIHGGVSQGSYKGLNLGLHVGDNSDHVLENRQRLQNHVGKNIQLCWLHQTHSDIVVNTDNYQQPREGDAAVSIKANKACVIMTADCLPILLCSQSGKTVAALHCGWKGLYSNLIAKTVNQYFNDEPIIAWLGPAIGQQSYEVDNSLYKKFVAANGEYQQAFYANRQGHYLFNLYKVARLQLISLATEATIYGGDFDTFSDTRFYSYRQQKQTGRIASVIYRI